MKIKFTIAWKMYFWLLFVFAISELLFGGFLHGIYQLAGLIGLYGFIWRVQIAHPIIWQIYLIFKFIELGFMGLQLSDPAFQSLIATRPQLSYFALVLIFVVNAPLYYALVRYASTKHKIWLCNT